MSDPQGLYGNTLQRSSDRNLSHNASISIFCLCFTRRQNIVLCYIALEFKYVMLCYVMLCYVMLSILHNMAQSPDIETFKWKKFEGMNACITDTVKSHF